MAMIWRIDSEASRLGEHGHPSDNAGGFGRPSWPTCLCLRELWSGHFRFDSSTRGTVGARPQWTAPKSTAGWCSNLRH